ncbi:MAG: M20/M25/M40 family metallo-hydrolase [Myxococcota bacterium]
MRKQLGFGWAVLGLCLCLFGVTPSFAEPDAVAAVSGTSSTAPPSAASREIAERLAGAIRFESVSYEAAEDFDAAPFEALAAFLAEHYPRTHAELALTKVNAHSMLFEWKGSAPDLAPGLFMSHLDVVPVSETALEGWDQPPFEGVIDDGFVWGRGAIDVKSGVILWLEAAEALLAEGFQPKRTLYLAFGHDEEIGGHNGAGAIAARLESEGVRLAFLFDEGGFLFDGHPLVPDRTVAQIVTAEKAYYTVVLTARGVSGHSSLPPRTTAIGKLSRAIAAVEANPMPTRLIEPVREMLAAAQPHVSGLDGFALGNLWLTKGMVIKNLLKDDVSAAMVRTTFAATLVSGGVKENVIPESAQATINVRILPGDTPEDVLAHLRKVIDDPEIEIEGTPWGPISKPGSSSGPAFQMAADAVRGVLPEAVVMPGLVPGATDTVHYMGITDEVLRFVPLRVGIAQVGGAHGRNERIAVAPLEQSRRIATDLMRRAGAGLEGAAGTASE